MLGWTVPFPVSSPVPTIPQILTCTTPCAHGPPHALSPLVYESYDLSPPQQEEPRPQVQWEQSDVHRDPLGPQLVELVLDAFTVLLLSCCAVVNTSYLHELI